MVPHSRFELAQSRQNETLEALKPAIDAEISNLKPEFEDWTYEK